MFAGSLTISIWCLQGHCYNWYLVFAGSLPAGSAVVECERSGNILKRALLDAQDLSPAVQLLQTTDQDVDDAFVALEPPFDMDDYIFGINNPGGLAELFDAYDISCDIWWCATNNMEQMNLLAFFFSFFGNGKVTLYPICSILSIIWPLVPAVAEEARLFLTLCLVMFIVCCGLAYLQFLLPGVCVPSVMITSVFIWLQLLGIKWLK